MREGVEIPEKRINCNAHSAQNCQADNTALCATFLYFAVSLSNEFLDLSISVDS